MGSQRGRCRAELGWGGGAGADTVRVASGHFRRAPRTARPFLALSPSPAAPV